MKSQGYRYLPPPPASFFGKRGVLKKLERESEGSEEESERVREYGQGESRGLMHVHAD